MRMLEDKKRSLKHCAPFRLIISILTILLILLIYFMQNNESLMIWIYDNLARPYHIMMANFTANFSFSLAEVILLGLIAITVFYILYKLYRLIKYKNYLHDLYLALISLVTIWSPFLLSLSLLWSPCYQAASFSELSGISDGAVSYEDLVTVTEYFVDIINEYADKVERDEDGLYVVDKMSIMERSGTLYNIATEEFSFLDGEAISPKAVYFSSILSELNTSGFFFPMTGEANINMMLPSTTFAATIMHELTHQRGIAAEQECNFVAVLACLNSEDAEFIYSGALFAYIYLGNSIYSVDTDTWREIRATVCDEAIADLVNLNTFWAQYEDTVAQTVSETIYDSYLQSNSQELGIKSYGACVDLLVNYYIEFCR